jgi:hypothetical protein
MKNLILKIYSSLIIVKFVYITTTFSSSTSNNVKLINYWPMSNLNDLIGETNLYNGYNYSFVSDRFCTPNSAIYLRNGFLQIPDGVYLSSDFTVTIWINLKSYQSWSRIFTFGKEQSNGNVLFSMYQKTSDLYIGNKQTGLRANANIELNKWHFVSVVLKETTVYIYVNGIIINSGSLIKLNNLRKNNFIGKSNYANDPYIDAIFDEIKIYKGVLSGNEMNLSYYSSLSSMNSCNSTNNNQVFLINHWPMSNLSDIVGKADLYNGFNYSFVSDRFCTPNSAIYFRNGFLQVPEGVYFSGDFTVTAWIYLKSFKMWQRIIDFGNGELNENVLLAMIRTTSKIHASVYEFSSCKGLDISDIIELNKWYFISLVLNGKKGYIYVDGNLFASGPLLRPNDVLRKNNYIGKSNWPSDSNADAIYDEIKIYKGALSPNSIISSYYSSLSTISSCDSIKNRNIVLINHWSMSSLSDVIGRASLFKGSNYSFASDRFGTPNSAIYFRNGYLQVPEGVYFSGDFTVTVWIYLKSYQWSSGIFNFGNEESIDNVGLEMYENSSKITGYIYKEKNYSQMLKCLPSIVTLNQWHFVSFVLSNTTGYIYVNESIIASYPLLRPNAVLRKKNYIGKNYLEPNSNIDAIYDEIKIYKGALLKEEIISSYNSLFKDTIFTTTSTTTTTTTKTTTTSTKKTTTTSTKKTTRTTTTTTTKITSISSANNFEISSENDVNDDSSTESTNHHSKSENLFIKIFFPVFILVSIIGSIIHFFCF